MLQAVIPFTHPSFLPHFFKPRIFRSAVELYERRSGQVLFPASCLPRERPHFMITDRGMDGRSFGGQIPEGKLPSGCVGERGVASTWHGRTRFSAEPPDAAALK